MNETTPYDLNPLENYSLLNIYQFGNQKNTYAFKLPYKLSGKIDRENMQKKHGRNVKQFQELHVRLQ